MKRLSAEFWLFLFLGTAPFLFLHSRGLIEPDEGRYAEMALEMLVGGDWLMPTLHGFAHPQKPPLVYWATAASFCVFGLNEFAARMPSVLAGFGTLVMVYWVARTWFSRNAGLWAAGMLGVSLEFFVLNRTLTPDMSMSFWILTAVACYARWTVDSRAKWMLGFFIAMGLGFLTKGPLAFVVPISGALVWQWKSRQRIPWLWGLPLALGIALSWFAIVAAKYPQLLNFFVGEELVGRVASNHHGRSKPFYFFIPILLGGLMPWTLFATPIIKWMRSQRGGPWSFIAGATIIPFLILSCSSSKLLTYILPILPICAVAFGAWAAQYIHKQRLLIAGAVASVLWVAALSQMNRFNDVFKRQASTRSLGRQILKQDRSAPVFIYGANTPGIEFYIQRTVSVSRDQADFLLPPSALGRPVLETPADCERLGTRAFGITVSRRIETEFPSAKWEVIDKAGDFRLIRLRK